MKKKRIAALLLTLTLLLTGCGEKVTRQEGATSATSWTMSEEERQKEEQAQILAAATVPADGDPDDVTAKGSYTGNPQSSTVVATIGESTLTLGELQAYYWAEVAQYKADHPDDGPDDLLPLDKQSCTVDSSVNSWQQYFLRRALNAWHTAQALQLQSEDTVLTFEEEYQPNEENHAKYLEDIPATKVLYGYYDHYQVNSMHQTYLDGLGDTVEELAAENGYADGEALAQEAFGTTLEDLLSYAELYNRGYMYLTYLSYDLSPTEEEVTAYYEAHSSEITNDGSRYVDIREALIIPDGVVETNPYAQDPKPDEEVTVGDDGIVTCSEEAWEACRVQAEALLTSWKNSGSKEKDFSELANKNSDDTGTALDGGGLERIAEGQLIDELDAWCFDEERQVGDTTAIRTDYGYVLLYYAGSTESWYAEAEDGWKQEQEENLIRTAREAYPMEVDYSAIVLAEAEPSVSSSDLLYQDIAHERYPEVPLYLQQDYPSVTLGGFPIRTYGCGITSMAMLATYMTDEPMTPPVVCKMFGSYGSSQGTDGMIFNKEPQGMGFYLVKKTYDADEVYQALQEGHVCVSIQTHGYWTSAGHYIVLEKLNEDGTVQVRDSNIYNYNNSWRSAQAGHLVDAHSWSSITAASIGYWIFDYKITQIPACERCGDLSQTNCHILQEDNYLCRKCRPAVLRRSVYLDNLA